jgi:hypothetical protein
MARKRRRRRSRRIARDQIPLDPDVPTYDYLEHIDLDDPGDVDQALDNLIDAIKTGYFLQWEAVVRQEQGLPLTRKQKRILTSLISFGAEEDDRILYIDEIPRPKEPWNPPSTSSPLLSSIGYGCKPVLTRSLDWVKPRSLPWRMSDSRIGSSGSLIC